MLITPQDFLDRSRKNGFSNCFYKGVMASITNEVPLDLLSKRKQKLYFIATTDFRNMRYEAISPKEVPHSEDEIFTEAFKLLNIIAD